jgi:hypothetical protein
VLCWAVPCRAVLCCAVLCCAGLNFLSMYAALSLTHFSKGQDPAAEAAAGILSAAAVAAGLFMVSSAGRVLPGSAPTQLQCSRHAVVEGARNYLG